MSTNQKPEFLLSLDPEEFRDPDQGESFGSRNEAALLFLMNRCLIFARRPVINFRPTPAFDELSHKR